MEEKTIVALIHYLRGFITDERWLTLNKILDLRTDYITVVLENIYQSHNAGAVLRSCDGFGVQTVHVVETQNEFDISGQVTVGADRWLDVIRYNKSDRDNTTDCIRALKRNGYRIVATTPHEKESFVQDLDISKPIALVFGNELDGISPMVLDEADDFVTIPMFGFSESFNISVSAAVCLYDLSLRIRNPVSEVDWRLGDARKNSILVNWLRNSLKAGEELVEKFISETDKQ